MGFVKVLILLLVLPSIMASANDPVREAGVSIASANHEIVIVFNSRLQQIARFEGGASSTVVKITYRWKGGVLVHNHPYPSLPDLSIPDLDTASVASLSEIRVYSVSAGFLQVCRAWPLGRWPRFNVITIRTQIHSLIDYKPWTEQVNVLRNFMIDLSYRMHFGYECKVV